SFLAHQVLEQEELTRRERDSHLAAPCDSALEIEADPTAAQVTVASVHGPQADVDTSEQLREIEWFADVVAGPQLQAPNLGVDVGERREDDHELIGSDVEHAPKNREAVDVGEHQIEDHELEAVVTGQLQTAQPIGRDGDVVTGGIKRTRDQARNACLVFDHEDRMPLPSSCRLLLLSPGVELGKGGLIRYLRKSKRRFVRRARDEHGG